MFAEWVAALPGWLLVGIAVGAGAAVVVACIFLLGQRFVPATESRTGSIDGSTRRRGEIRRYLGEIDERYQERATVAGQDVAFYLPDREVAITFDPQSYHRLTDAGASAAGVAGEGVYVILAEHEMPGHQLGERLPFETPDVIPDRTERSVQAAFETLGVAADASADRVEAAYRDRVKDVHPDQGGSREAFSELQEAYATAREHAEER